jgi:hypothetical protein
VVRARDSRCAKDRFHAILVAKIQRRFDAEPFDPESFPDGGERYLKLFQGTQDASRRTTPAQFENSGEQRFGVETIADPLETGEPPAKLCGDAVERVLAHQPQRNTG